LWQVLDRLPEQRHPDLIIGANQADDCGVVRISEETAIILSLDFFPAIVDDPYIFGQVAAANALSDVYAMGGKPLTALNIVCFPEGDLPLELLGDVLRGGAEKVNEAGGIVVGGHTIKDRELKYGLSVAGIINPKDIISTGDAKAGDRLVLTKPLGTGIYSTALKEGKLARDREHLFYEIMTALNRAAAEEMRTFGAHACTDVTGFGLLGHSLEMAQMSDVTISFDAGAVPLLPGVLELAKKGYLTGGGMSNREFVKDSMHVLGELSGELEMVLCDPQTSGGLLVSLPADRAGDYVAAVRGRGVAQAVLVGEVTAPDEHRLIIRV
jgi:selenide,water dikinase